MIISNVLTASAFVLALISCGESHIVPSCQGNKEKRP